MKKSKLFCEPRGQSKKENEYYYIRVHLFSFFSFTIVFVEHSFWFYNRKRDNFFLCYFTNKYAYEPLSHMSGSSTKNRQVLLCFFLSYTLLL